MEESLELPSSDEQNNPHFPNVRTNSKQSSNQASLMGSPAEPSSISKFRINHNNESQESLQYSISTYKEDTHRSPKFINLPLLEIDKPKIKVEEERMRGKETTNIAAQPKNKKLRLESPQTYNPASLADVDQRKTLQTRNSDYIKLMKRNRELEHALQLETMVSEELRSKLSIMSETLEMNIREAGVGDFLKLRNSSKSSNVDIFVEFQRMKKENESKNKESAKETSRLKQENEGLAKHLMLRTNEVERSNRTIKSLESQVKVLEDRIALHIQSLETKQTEERESLMSYIDELKREYSLVTLKLDESTAKIRQMQQEIHSLKDVQTQVAKLDARKRQNDQTHEQEVRRLSNIIQDKNQLIEHLNLETSEMKAEFEEDILRRDEIIQAMEQRIMKLEPLEERANLYPDSLDAITKVDIGIGSDRSPPSSARKKTLITPHKNSSPQAPLRQSSQKKQQLTSSKADKRMMDRLRWELQSYKQECDYYHQEYLKKITESAELHALKLQYRTDMEYLKDKIRELTHGSSSNKKTRQPLDRVLAI